MTVYTSDSRADDKQEKNTKDLANPQRDPFLLAEIVDHFSQPQKDQKNGPVTAGHCPDTRADPKVTEKEYNAQTRPKQTPH